MASLRQIHFINFSRKLTINTIFFLVPLYFLQIGFTGWQIGVITSLYAFAPLLFSFPTGWINDRLSIRGMIHGALVVLVILFLLMGSIRNFILMAILFLLLGVANNALDMSCNSLYYKDETDMDLNRKYGLMNFWLSMGAAVGVLLGGVFTFYTDFHTLFMVYAAYLVAVLLGVLNLPEGRFNLIPIRKYKLSLLNKKTILFSLLIFILTLHWGAESTVYSPFLRETFHLNNLQLALYIALPLFILSFASFTLCCLKYNRRMNERIFLFAMLLSGIGHVLMVQSSVSVSFFFRVVHELGDGFLAALIFVFISRLFEKENIGGSSGILLAVMTLGHMVGSLVFSPIGYTAGLHYPFIISGLLLIVNTAFGIYVFRSERY
ncbi:MAG: MFS transporter [bacterium]